MARSADLSGRELQMMMLIVLVIGFCWIGWNGASKGQCDAGMSRQLLTLIIVAIALDYARGIF
jgi:hypothetical protein